eukprot:scaffold14920_cov63-Cylindrotheca_fusiformis.AAC.3
MSSPTVVEEENRQEQRERRHVCFDTIEIIELPYCLGDNPAVSSGVPISIEWEAQSRIKLSLAHFEAERQSSESTTTTSTTTPRILRIPSRRRRDILLSCGHSPAEIQHAIIDAAIGKQRRRLTLKSDQQQQQCCLETYNHHHQVQVQQSQATHQAHTITEHHLPWPSLRVQ